MCEKEKYFCGIRVCKEQKMMNRPHLHSVIITHVEHLDSMRVSLSFFVDFLAHLNSWPCQSEIVNGNNLSIDK